jgi:hypothetical protein
MRPVRIILPLLAVFLVMAVVGVTGQSQASANIGVDGFVPITPYRALDTRLPTSQTHGEQLPAGQIIEVGPFPDTGLTHAVVVNLTVSQPAAKGYLSAYPCTSGPPPTISNLNFQDSLRSNLAIVPTSPHNTICVFTYVTTHIVVDVFGTMQAGGLYYTASDPAGRLYDSRLRPSNGPLRPNGAICVQPPPNTAAAVLNITVANPSADGYLTVWPKGSVRPLVSNVNFVAGQTTANLAMSSVGGTDHGICIYSNVETDLAVDLQGTWQGSGNAYRPEQPHRVFDSRVATDQSHGASLAAGSSINLQLPMYLSFKGQVALNVTSTEASGPGYLTVWPCGGKMPTTSNLNYTPGVDVANMALVSVTPGTNTVCVSVYAGFGSTHVVLDEFGLFDTNY